jgi:hypothetical protein
VSNTEAMPVKKTRLVQLCKAVGNPTELDVLPGDTVEDALVELAVVKITDLRTALAERDAEIVRWKEQSAWFNDTRLATDNEVELKNDLYTLRAAATEYITKGMTVAQLTELQSALGGPTT